MEQGFIQVYTGNGKGKTTAALGLALRAIGHGMKVLVVQFMKGHADYGEEFAARGLSPYLSLLKIGRNTFVSKSHPDPEDIQRAREGLDLARKAVQSRDYDMVILDEINPAVDFGLIPLPDLLQLLEAKPETVEIILTGRNARPEVLDRADLITEMVERRHYFKRGISARKGIER